MDSSAIRQVKPVVMPAQYLLGAPLIAGCLSLFVGGFAFIISNIIWLLGSESPSRGGPVISVGAVAFAASFVVSMVLLWMKMFREPKLTTYTIFPDRIEYDEGMWNRHWRTVLFDQVIDVELTEGVLQQTRQAGTITIVTQHLVAQGGRNSVQQADRPDQRAPAQGTL